VFCETTRYPGEPSKPSDSATSDSVSGDLASGQSSKEATLEPTPARSEKLPERPKVKCELLQSVGGVTTIRTTHFLLPAFS
jgi:hypothetical protein